MTRDSGADEVPVPTFGARPQHHVEIQLVGDTAVDMLNEVTDRLAGVSDPKGAVLRMLGVFHSAIDAEVLVQRGDDEARRVEGLWK